MMRLDLFNSWFKSKLKKLKILLLTKFIKNTFLFWQKLGIHIILNDYNSPIPNTSTLKQNLWLKQKRLIGINLQEKNQLKLLTNFVVRYKKEYERFPRQKTSDPTEYYINNLGFETVDGEVLYCIIRDFKPSKIIEIGAGNSTLLISQAIHKNQFNQKKYHCDFTSIDPNITEIFRLGIPDNVKIIPKQVQNISLTKLKYLRKNDILFIDSSHVLKIGSDVQYEFLEILPRLQKGVLVHIHDIFLPAEYCREIIYKDYHFLNEQYILQAFLTFNNAFEVIWAGSFMHLKHSEELTKAFSSYDRNKAWPASFWIRKII